MYDGQFLNLVRYAEDGIPLTRLAFFQQFFKELKKWSKVQCISYLVTEAISNGIPLNLLTTPDNATGKKSPDEEKDVTNKLMHQD